MSITKGQGSMESALALSMVVDIFRNTYEKTFIGEMVTDDDSTIRAVLSHNEKKGRLSHDVPPPKFLADPGHRVKVIVEPIFAKVSKTKAINRIKNIDTMRIKKYTSCYIVQNREGDFNKFVANVLAPIEHLFNEHSYCDAEWCWSKEMDEKVHEILSTKTKSKV